MELLLIKKLISLTVDGFLKWSLHTQDMDVNIYEASTKNYCFKIQANYVNKVVLDYVYCITVDLNSKETSFFGNHKTDITVELLEVIAESIQSTKFTADRIKVGALADLRSIKLN